MTYSPLPRYTVDGFKVVLPYDIGRLGQRLFSVDLAVGPIQVTVQLAPLLFGKPVLLALFLLTPLVALAAQGLAGPLLRLLPTLRLHQRAETRVLITGAREHRGEQHNDSSNQEQPRHQPVSAFRAAPCPGAAYRIIDVPAAGPAGESLARLTHLAPVLIT